MSFSKKFQKGKRWTPERLAMVDWSKTNAVIARELGLSRERVSVLRGMAGHSEATGRVKPHHPLDDVTDEQWGAYTNGEIAALNGWPTRLVSVYRTRHNKPSIAEITLSKLRSVPVIKWQVMTSHEISMELHIFDERLVERFRVRERRPVFNEVLRRKLRDGEAFVTTRSVGMDRAKEMMFGKDWEEKEDEQEQEE